jgi:membrane protease YdiL (CAAX protease family)
MPASPGTDPANTLSTRYGQRLGVAGALAVGGLLWFLPTLLLPVLDAPLIAILRATGLLEATADGLESRFAAALVLRWLAVALLLAFVVGVERERLASVGLRRPRRADLALALGVGVLTLVAGVTLYALVQGPQPETGTQTAQILDSLGLAGRLHLIVNAAVVEELFFRGFLIERLIRLGASPWLAGAVSFVLFVGGHLSGGGLVQTLTLVAVGSLGFVLLYLLRRNVITCIATHAVTDLLVLLA